LLEAANGNKITVDVVASVSSPYALLSYWEKLRRLG